MYTTTDEIESLKLELQDIRDAVEKIDALNNYASKVRSSNIVLSLEFSQQAVELAEKSEYKEGLARAYWNRGIAGRLLAKYDDALKDFDSAYHIFLETGDVLGQSKILNSQGNIYFALSDYAKAIHYFNKASEAAARTDNRIQEAIIFSNIGLVYQETGDYPTALENYFKSMQIYADHSNKIPFSVYNNIGIVYQEIRDYATALEYYFRTLEAVEAENNLVDKAYTLGNIAMTYGDLKEYDNSIKYFRESLDIIKNLKYRQAETNGLNNLANAYKKAGLYEKALDYFRQAINLSEEIGDSYTKSLSLNLIGEIYATMGEYDSAKGYYEESLVLSKSTNDTKNQITSYLDLGKLYKNTQDLDASLRSFNSALGLAEQSKALKDMSEIHKEISGLYSLKEMPVKALEHYKIHHKLENEQYDSNIDKRLKAIFLQNQIKSKDKDYQIALKEKELYRLRNVELAELNTKLQNLNAEIKDFLGIVVHDLKNPLSGIKAYSGKLRRSFDKVSPDDIKEMAVEMEKASEKMFGLIERLLDANTIESGKRVYKFNRIDLSEVIELIVSDLAEAAKSKGIKISFKPGKNSDIYVDLTSIKQIVENLISNAIKFTPQEKNVCIEVVEKNGFYQAHVKDEGPGLTEQDKSKMFSKFPRMSAKPTGGELSTGLGLYIVKKLTDANNGKIWCESIEGKGADFIVEFPSYETSIAGSDEPKKQ